MLAIFNRPDRPTWPWEVGAFVTAGVALGRCVVDETSGELVAGWPRLLEWCTGLSWSDINGSFLPSGVTERMGPGSGSGSLIGPDGHALPERLTDAGRGFVWMARIAWAARAPKWAHDDGSRDHPMHQAVYCSSCGECFGPGDWGFSHCEDHARLVALP